MRRAMPLNAALRKGLSRMGRGCQIGGSPEALQRPVRPILGRPGSTFLRMPVSDIGAPPARMKTARKGGLEKVRSRFLSLRQLFLILHNIPDFHARICAQMCAISFVALSSRHEIQRADQLKQSNPMRVVK